MDWQLLSPALNANYAGRVQQGFQAGNALAEQRAMHAALQAYAANPQDPHAMQFIMSRNPTLGAQLDDRARAGLAREAVATILAGDMQPQAQPMNALAPQANAPQSGVGMNSNALASAMLPPPPQGGGHRFNPRTPQQNGTRNALLDAGASDPLAPLPDGPRPFGNSNAGLPSNTGNPTPTVADMPAPKQASQRSDSSPAWQALAQADPSMFMQLRKMRREDQQQVAKTLQAQMDVGGRVMSAVLQAPPEQQDSLYQELRQEMETAGITDLPEQWDPAQAQARMRMGMTVLQALGSDRADANSQSLIEDRGRRVNEYARHNQAMEANTRHSQDVTSTDRRRGQNMTDKRIRDSASFQGKGGGGGSSGVDLIGTVYQRGGHRIQYSKRARGYVDLATGHPVQ